VFGQKPTMPINIDMATNSPENQLQKCLEAGAFTIETSGNHIPATGIS